MRGAWGVVRGGLVVLVAAGCQSFGGARPRHAPLPDAVVLETSRPVSVALAALRDSLVAAGLTIAVDAPREGYLLSGWYDLGAPGAARPPFTGLERTVRLRFFVDPEGLHTRVVGECVRRVAWDPSRPERELEVMVPDSHAGRGLLERMLAGVRDTVTTRDTTVRR